MATYAVFALSRIRLKKALCPFHSVAIIACSSHRYKVIESKPFRRPSLENKPNNYTAPLCKHAVLRISASFPPLFLSYRPTIQFVICNVSISDMSCLRSCFKSRLPFFSCRPLINYQNLIKSWRSSLLCLETYSISLLYLSCTMLYIILQCCIVLNSIVLY